MHSNTTPPIITIILAASTLVAPAPAATLHVPADYPTIQSCIDAAVSGQDECVVAPGTYNELINFLGKAITLRSSHGPAVTTIDGTGLNGSVVQIKNHEGEQTIFDGFTVTGGKGTSVSGYVKGGGMYILNASPVVSNSIFSMNEAELGGGVWNSGRPTISHCNFLNNSGEYGGGIFHERESQSLISDCFFQENQVSERGGGLYTQSSTHAVERCQFIWNTASVGGGMRNSYSTVRIIDCDFIENTAALTGGGIANGDPDFSSEHFLETDSALRLTSDIYEIKGGTFVSNKSLGNAPNQGGGAVFDNGRSTEISNAKFESNSAHCGGAVLAIWSATLRDCQFANNQADENGGGLWGGEKVETSSFINNHAGSDGGGIYHDIYHSGSVEKSFFLGNSAQRGGGVFGPTEVEKTTFIANLAVDSGGALSGSGAVSSIFIANKAGEAGGGIYADSPTRVVNSLFNYNIATFGGGVYNAAGASVYSSTFFGNHASDSGGAISNLGYIFSGTDLSIVNSILWGNSAPNHGPQFWSSEELFATTVAFSNIQDSGGSANWDSSIGIDEGGNIDLDPAFVRLPDDGGDGWGDDPSTPNLDESLNDDFGDLRLLPGSPCINAGNSSWVASIPADLDGYARVLCDHVDMGAYEYGIGDYDCDQTVNLIDFGGWDQCATDPGAAYPDGCEAFDFDGDGDVDLSDLAQFILIAGS